MSGVGGNPVTDPSQQMALVKAGGPNVAAGVNDIKQAAGLQERYAPPANKVQLASAGTVMIYRYFLWNLHHKSEVIDLWKMWK